MAEFPALPLWTDAYLADTSHLDDAERGRYDLILFHLWRAPNQRFPNDDTWLARKFGRSVERVISEIRPLITEFCNCDGNWIRQKRLDKEWAYVAGQSAKQAERAEKRWGGDRARDNAAIRSKRMSEARKKGTHTAAEWDALKSIIPMCAHCLGRDYPLEKDHIKPVYQGGSDAIENIQPSCAKCNARKGAECHDKRAAARADWLVVFEGTVRRKLLKDNDGNVCLSGIHLLSAPTPTPTPTPKEEEETSVSRPEPAQTEAPSPPAKPPPPRQGLGAQTLRMTASDFSLWRQASKLTIPKGWSPTKATMAYLALPNIPVEFMIEAWAAYIDDCRQKSANSKYPQRVMHPENWFRERRYESYLDAIQQADHESITRITARNATLTQFGPHGDAILARVGAAKFDAWLLGSKLTIVQPARAILEIPKAFVAKWLTENPEIVRHIEAVTGAKVEITQPSRKTA